MKQKGQVIVLVLVLLVGILAVIGIGIAITKAVRNTQRSHIEDTKINERALINEPNGVEKNQTPAVTNTKNTDPKQGTTDPNTPPLLLKTIGVNLDYFDATTGMAGDFKFTKKKIELGMIFTEYGHSIPGNSATDYKPKTDPQSELRLPMGTKVHSLVDGVVANVPKLYSDDYSVQVSDGVHENWLYETEHVINPLVKVGDKVIAGQVIAEVSPHSKDGYDGLGVVELGILHGGNPPSHVCPFAYLDPSIKESTLAKITAFYKSWEEYRGDTLLYDEAKMTIPGCNTLDALPG